METGIDPKVDYAFKRVFAGSESADILPNLLNAVLMWPSDKQVTSVEILNPFSQIAASLSGGELLPFLGQLPLGAGQRVTQVLQTDLEIHEGGVQTLGLLPRRPGRARFREQSVQSGLEIVDPHMGSKFIPRWYLWEPYAEPHSSPGAPGSDRGNGSTSPASPIGSASSDAPHCEQTTSFSAASEPHS